MLRRVDTPWDFRMQAVTQKLPQHAGKIMNRATYARKSSRKAKGGLQGNLLRERAPAPLGTVISPL
jgi:hypothetical protein